MEELIRHRPLAAEAASLRTGERDLLAHVEYTCDLIDAVDDHISAFVSEPDRLGRLRAEAEATRTRWPLPAERPALYGVPVGVKDIMHADGLATGAGSAVPAAELSGQQAVVVDRLRAAGAVVAGKTVTAEFAITAPGPTRNPHHLDHSPGGSSSGSAAAVAAGLVPLAIGTQTVGSMIRPAAYCGVVGYKPSYGRIPVDGVIANAPSLDTLGVFAADVAGVTRAAQVLCDDWRTKVAYGTAGASEALPVLGVPTGPYLARADAAAIDAFEEQQQRLREAGFTVLSVPFMPDFDEIYAQQFTVNRYEAARTHAEWFPRFGDLYREQTVAAIRQGQDVTADDYARALDHRREFRDRVHTTLTADGIDLWITPAATGIAPKGLATTGNSVMCLPWTYAGLPALTVPAGRLAPGLPLGLQCVARAGADEELLHWAPVIETVAAAGFRAAIGT
ncbi:amidase [Streptomyces zagrosensis]|uniref:Asp-tRNA(Asn)/Glu-tRNA(Gln) amidotransferase A subunit family amidase n=1 Tax=Streptomyces zagrosensis TaxID=1042984 RepID=A0A7W9V0R2_9ACTN|nr:amidase [Streptomyces zagrosensis]MBB5938385.1 Asp-tRNA(Asn)/Glu-tRNA(Gln) amidotransferase A subunit family amidase [Streptomyces zagrosensis]